MKFRRRKFLAFAGSTVLLPSVRRAARAQSYPSRPVHMIVPFGPGGPTDLPARLVGQRLSERFGKQFYVENVPGASGNIGAGQAAKAAPDGLTLLVTVNSLVINPNLFDRVPYEPFKDFDPITLVVSFATLASVHPSVPAKTLGELVTLIRANPGRYSFASPGLGTPSHLLAEALRQTLKLDLVHVPFGGSGPAIASVVGGHTPICFAGLAAAEPQVRSGNLRGLAMMSNKRSAALPEVPTIAEAGYPGIVGDGWVGVLVPAGTPKDIAALLHDEIIRIIAEPEIKNRLAALGLDPVGSTPQEFAATMRAESETWAKIIRAGNIKAQ